SGRFWSVIRKAHSWRRAWRSSARNLPPGSSLSPAAALRHRSAGESAREWMAASKAAYDYKAGADSEEDFIRANSTLRRTNDPAIERLFRENYRRAVASGQIEMFRLRSPEETDIERYTLLQEEHIHPYLPQLAMPVL